jgi:hypothetical protein
MQVRVLQARRRTLKTDDSQALIEQLARAGFADS